MHDAIITLAELKQALKRELLYSPAEGADATAERIFRMTLERRTTERKGWAAEAAKSAATGALTFDEILTDDPPVSAGGAPGSTRISEAELREAMARRHYGSAVTAARDIVLDVLNHREPEWKTGDLARDASGELWQCAPPSTQCSGHDWYKFGFGRRYADIMLPRPLKKVDI